LQADYAGKPCPFWFLGLALPYSGVVACRRSQLKISATPGKIAPSLGLPSAFAFAFGFWPSLLLSAFAFGFCFRLSL
jgi:hypothetical protein